MPSNDVIIYLLISIEFLSNFIIKIILILVEIMFKLNEMIFCTFAKLHKNCALGDLVRITLPLWKPLR